MVSNILKYLLIMLIANAPFNIFSQTKKQYLIIGTYTQTQDKGLFVYSFNPKTGELTFESNTENINNPSYLAINKTGNKVYSVDEDINGGVNSFNFNKDNGKLSFINSQKVNGQHPCYIILSANEKHLVTANYSSGNLSVLPINTDGSLSPLKQLIQHNGSSIDKSRQNNAHTHSVINSPDGKFMFAADLGTDKIYAYQYQPDEQEVLKVAKQASIDIKPGSGPRHFIFNKKGNVAYLIEELSATISVYSYKNQELKELQRVAMNAADFNGKNGAADIHLSHDGKFLYASNRGTANDISIFKIDQKTGLLNRIGSHNTGGKNPRNFAIDPTDKFLLGANQSTNDVIVFSRNKKTGLLKKTGQKINLGAPVCLVFVKP
jgi:6-phosphogluconolactonase